MNIASLEFIAFAVLAASLYNLFRPVSWRQWILLVANLFVLSTFSTNLRALLPFLGFLLLGYAGIKAMETPVARKAFIPFLVIIVAAFVWLKKYTFLPPSSFLPFSYFTVGLSYILFRLLHVLIDARAEVLPARISLISYLNYTLNFMTLVSGPIQRYEDFAATQLAPARAPLTIFTVGEGVHRVVVGFFKVTVLSWLLLAFQKQALTALGGNPFLRSSVFTATLVAAAFPLYLYFNFSGYTDIVIGIGRFFRFSLPENFDRPFSSANFIDFWNRWHITLSSWLKTYVFNPLLLAEMRTISSESLELFLVVPALFVTFFLIGFWHGQTSEFLMFGFLQGFGVAATQLYQIVLRKFLGRQGYLVLSSNAVYTAFSRGLTFTWFTLTLFWFWSSWAEIGRIASVLRSSGVLLVLVAIFLAATLLLEVFEVIRVWVLNFCKDGQPILFSRYVLTVYDTGLTVISLAVVLVLNVPAPDLVYKAF